MISSWFEQRSRGSVLLFVVVFMGIVATASIGVLRMTSVRNTKAHERQHWNEAWFHAENAVTTASQAIADDNTPTAGTPAFLGRHILQPPSVGLASGVQQMALPYAASQAGSLHDQSWLTISNHPNGLPRFYEVVTSARVGNAVRTIRATVQKNPPSQIFDYEYFLNNWGWWWGSSITGFGDNRANWDFDFRYNPTVNGEIFAAGEVEENMSPVDVFGGSVPFRGDAATDPVAYVHIGAPRLRMPNLKDLTYYETKATTEAGTVIQNGTTMVAAVHGDNEAKPGLYLDGTTNPIEVSGPVVVRGDLIIKGTITGTGTFYVGGNLYIAGDMTYGNGPSFDPPPAGLSQANEDQWVADALTDKKDLVAFAVRETILGGDVNSSNWIRRCYNPRSYGLKNVGNESILGQDGIRDTPDDNVDYLDTTGDGVADSSWYDADEDGVVDGNYVHSTDIQVTSARANAIQGYPVDGSGNPVAYSGNVATNYWNRLDGIFYCNHAVALRPDKSNLRINGSIICRDEAIIFNRTARFVYDSRIHSRYSNDPNRYIDLGLPVANLVRVTELAELGPIEGFYQ